MEFIKVGKNYMIKNSNGRIVSEKEKLELENKELVLEDIKAPCAKDITKKISKNKKRLKEIEKEEKKTNGEVIQDIHDGIVFVDYEETALNEGAGADDTIEETDTTI
jgi:alpha-amylase/alpha-mannosidase (GH57 family)